MLPLKYSLSSTCKLPNLGFSDINLTPFCRLPPLFLPFAAAPDPHAIKFKKTELRFRPDGSTAGGSDEEEEGGEPSSTVISVWWWGPRGLPATCPVSSVETPREQRAPPWVQLSGVSLRGFSFLSGSSSSVSSSNSGSIRVRVGSGFGCRVPSRSWLWNWSIDFRTEVQHLHTYCRREGVLCNFEMVEGLTWAAWDDLRALEDVLGAVRRKDDVILWQVVPHVSIFVAPVHFMKPIVIFKKDKFCMFFFCFCKLWKLITINYLLQDQE